MTVMTSHSWLQDFLIGRLTIGLDPKHLVSTKDLTVKDHWYQQTIMYNAKKTHLGWLIGFLPPK